MTKIYFVMYMISDTRTKLDQGLSIVMLNTCKIETLPRRAYAPHMGGLVSVGMAKDP